MSTELQVAQRFLELHPREAARILDRHDPSEIVELTAGLPPALAAAAIPRLSGRLGPSALALMDPQAAGALLSLMPSGTAAHLLRRMNPDPRNSALEQVALARRPGIRRLLNYPEGTVGALMDPDPPALPLEAAVSEARSLIAGPVDRFAPIYLLDPDRRLAGRVTRERLDTATPEAPLAGLAVPVPAALSPHDALLTATAHPGWVEEDQLPVVDLDGLLQGAVTHRQLRAWAGARLTGEGPDPLKTTLGVVELLWVGLFGLVETVAAEGKS